MFEKLNDLLNSIETRVNDKKVTVMENLKFETERLYTFHALGICKSKLTNTDSKEHREGMNKTKIYFERVKDFQF